MKKMCILNSAKICDNCGECLVCDLDSSVRCNNCGRCLQSSEADLKAVSIDEIDEDSQEYSDEEKLFHESSVLDDAYTDFDEELYENNESWELIDDIDGLGEILTDDKSFKEIASELFPGLIKINRNSVN